MKYRFTQFMKMSLKIIKAGILDTIQDSGRFGYQSSGINPSGTMDRLSAQLANSLLGKQMDAPLIEMHFPAPTIEFEEATIICITGADFNPEINGAAIPNNQTIAVNKKAILEFKKAKRGALCYLSILQDLKLHKWLNSYCTNLKVEMGGYEGRSLKNGDVLQYAKVEAICNYLQDNNFKILPFKAEPNAETINNSIDVIKGNEWDWLTTESQQLFTREPFTISTLSDRMGYRLQGKVLEVKENQQLVSSAVNFGTLQLLPKGQLIVLMADHQTTGGYPRVGHVISAHLPRLAQMRPFESIMFQLADIETAEQNLIKQYHYLLSVQYASTFKLEKVLQ
jgi:antagonist of KipI